QRIHRGIIQRNIEALSYDVRSFDGRTQPVLQFAGLIEVIYWHLEKFADKPVRPCARCGSLFIVQRSNQRFCPHPTDPSKESLCAASARQAKRREAKRAAAR